MLPAGQTPVPLPVGMRGEQKRQLRDQRGLQGTELSRGPLRAARCTLRASGSTRGAGSLPAAGAPASTHGPPPGQDKAGQARRRAVGPRPSPRPHHPINMCVASCDFSMRPGSKTDTFCPIIIAAEKGRIPGSSDVFVLSRRRLCRPRSCKHQLTCEDPQAMTSAPDHSLPRPDDGERP